MLNAVKIFKHKKFDDEIHGDFVLRGFKIKDESEILNIFYQLNGESNLSWAKRALYRFFGDRMMIVATKADGAEDLIVGVNMYYFNKRDAIEKTIHEGFIGVLPEFGGKGIAAIMRKKAKKHYLSNGVNGISTRISLVNKYSLNSAVKLGFKPIEKYYDEHTNEERFYMVCELGGES